MVVDGYLYLELINVQDNDDVVAVLDSWLVEHGHWARSFIEPARRRDGVYDLSGYNDPLYALSRANDVLLLNRQPDPLPDDRELIELWRWLHWRGCSVHVDEALRLDFFGKLGMEPITPTAFHPSICEIVSVIEDPNIADVDVAAVAWTGLRFGDLIFSRAGVHVRANPRLVRQGVADRSTLYWTYRRRHRPTADLSMGWGHNSQWSTEHRRDYLTGDGITLNVGRDSRRKVASGAGLTAREFAELVIYRSLVRRAPPPGVDPWPYGHSLIVPHDQDWIGLLDDLDDTLPEPTDGPRP